MIRLLISAAAYADVAPDIARRAPGVAALVMDDTGALTLDGRPVAPEDARPEIAWIDQHAVLGGAHEAFFSAIVASPTLKWVQSITAGLDWPIYAQIIAKGAALSNSHSQSGAIADYVLWGVLDHLQGGAERRADRAARHWQPRFFREIADTHWLIIGFGAIGQGVAVRARAFGATITGRRRDQAAHPLADRIGALSDMIDLAPTADVIVLCVPPTPDTRHLADARLFSAMKPGSILVNVGRGVLVDEPALLAALDAGTPEHAVLDVFETEPLPTDSPFWSHPRVNLTPHCGGYGDRQAPRYRALFLDNLSRYAAGEPVLNRVDPRDLPDG